MLQCRIQKGSSIIIKALQRGGPLNCARVPIYRKVFDLFFFCENLVDFNGARLHEATLNLHTHALIFPACQIVS